MMRICVVSHHFVTSFPITDVTRLHSRLFLTGRPRKGKTRCATFLSPNRARQDKRLDHSRSEVPCGHIAQEFESVSGDRSGPIRWPHCSSTSRRKPGLKVEAAKKLGIAQPRISALMKDAWRDFSADMLLVLATCIGLRPTLKLAAQRGGTTARTEQTSARAGEHTHRRYVVASNSPHE